MKEQLITLETAKLAKEKGYNPFKLDEKLNQAIISNGTHHYINTRDIRTTSYYFYKEDDGKVECHEMRTGEMSSRYGRFDTVVEHYFGKETNSNYYHAPTQSLLQKWLRDVHKIIVLPNRDVHKNYKGYYYHTMTHYVEADKPIIVTEEDWKNFDTYEAALEAGLLKALKLIEDV
jgi:hypothetical protein